MSVSETAARQLGQRLQSILTPRALAAWIGTDRLSSIAALIKKREPPSPPPATYSAMLFSLLVAGDEVEVDDRRDEIDLLRSLRLVDVIGDRARARVAILPLGRSHIVCDRVDAADEAEHVCWPDDSSYHLAHCLPRLDDKEEWVDVGCGSAFAALLRPKVADAITCTDVNERAVRYAQLGLAISGIEHVRVHQMNLADGLDRTFALASCNAPIPASTGPYRSAWRATDENFMPRLFEALGAHGKTIVVHGALDALRPVVASLPGQRVLVAYTPDDFGGFGVVWWTPAAETRLVSTRRLLTVRRPHLTIEDRDAALDS